MCNVFINISVRALAPKLSQTEVQPHIHSGKRHKMFSKLHCKFNWES